AALLRATRELAGHVDEAEFTAIYDQHREGQSGGLRDLVAAHFLTETDRGRLSDLANAYWDHPPAALYEDVRETLKALSRDYRLGLLANQKRDIRQSLIRDGILGYFDVTAISGEVGFEKPDVRLFESVLAETGVPPEASVHVGNRLDKDVRPARALGMHT